MTIVEYNLFRIKFVKPAQRSLFSPEVRDATPSALFLYAIKERPRADLKNGQTWHIGNVNMLSETQGSFAMGRTTRTKLQKFDENSGDFLEEEQETSPFTTCVFDAEIGVVAIANKALLAKTAEGLASKLAMILSTVSKVTEASIEVQIGPIPNPDSFLEAIDAAWQVSRFTATFRGPNPFDADEYFQKPLSKYLNEAGGDRGKADIYGDDLNRDVVKQVAKSTAATGNNKVTARIRKSKGSKSQTIRMKEEPIKLTYSEEENDPKKVVKEIVTEYKGVRSDVK